jgi:hypothetical protein
LERRREIRIPDPQTKEVISVLLDTPLLPFGPIRRIDWKIHAIASDNKQYNLHRSPHFQQWLSRYLKQIPLKKNI